MRANSKIALGEVFLPAVLRLSKLREVIKLLNGQDHRLIGLIPLVRICDDTSLEASLPSPAFETELGIFKRR